MNKIFSGDCLFVMRHAHYDIYDKLYNSQYHTINNLIYDDLYHIIDQKWSKIKSLGRNAREEVKTMKNELNEHTYIIRRDILPSQLEFDTKHELNIRGDLKSLGTTQPLAKEIYRHGLIHPPTVAESNELYPGKFVVIDGHRRTRACQGLENNEIEKCSLPKNWRVSVLKDKYYEDLSDLERIAIRLSATDTAKPFTGMGVGMALNRAAEILSQKMYNESWEVIRADRRRSKTIYDDLVSYNPHLTPTKIKNAMKTSGGFHRMDDKPKKKVAEALGSGTLGEQTLAYILDLPKNSIDPVVDIAIKTYRDGAKTGKKRINAIISSAARITATKVRQERIDQTSEAIVDCFKLEIGRAEDHHTFSVNNCPRTLSKTIKKIARARGVTPSELAIEGLRKYTEEVQ